MRMAGIVLSAVLLAGISSAEPVRREASKEHEGVTGWVRVYVDKDSMSVSDSLQFGVEVTVPAGYRAELPAFSDFGFALDFSDRTTRFRPTDVGEPTTELLPDGSTALRQFYTLEPWLSGDYSIPPLMVSFFKAEAPDEDATEVDSLLGPIPAFSVITTAIRLAVTPLADDRRQLVDIYGQSDFAQDALKKRVRRQEDKSEQELQREDVARQKANLALNDRSFPWWLLWGVLGGAAVATLVWVFGRRRIAALLSPKRLPAHELAYQALRELASKELPASGMVKEFYYELSYILREYVGNRFQVYAIHQSTEEFLQGLISNNPFDSDSEQVLREFSELADTVKYSRHRPGTDVADKSYDVARSFVDNTRQLEEEAA